MEIRLESKKGEVVEGVDQARAGIHERLQQQPEQWLRKLLENPGDFAELEQTVHRAFNQMADQMMAGLLAQATQPAEFTQVAKKK
jgi:hypothetical protein